MSANLSVSSEYYKSTEASTIQQAYLPQENGDVFEYLSEESKDLKVMDMAQKYGINPQRLLLKTDLCVLPPFVLLYFVTFINRSSFGLVIVDGILEDLNITTLQLMGAYAAFFAPIVLFQVQANSALRLIKPHFFIAISVLVYGAFNLACAFSKNYASFVVFQFFHGLFQSGSETTTFYILAHYYERREAQKRFSSVYSVSCLAGMTTNLLSYAVNDHLNMVRGYAPWRWLMIILGATTMFVAIILFFTIPDFPEGARFFNDDEARFIISKLELFGGKSGYSLKVTKKELLKIMQDPVVFLPVFVGLSIGYVNHGYSLYEPIVFKTLSYSTKHANVYSSFPWILSFGWTVICGFVSDLIQKRSPILFLNFLVVIAGAILIFCDLTDGPTHSKYAGNFLIVSGSFASLPILICWSSLNVCGHSRKSLVTSVTISLHDLGGLIALFSFYKNESLYRQSFIAGFCLTVCGVILASIYLSALVKNNQKKRSANYKNEFDKYSEKEKIIMGDRDPLFDYML